ncbi:MAG: hypothetical protein M3464_00255 [Chloroflexota bacterium]|nr:hypothetical protein [Chloroflexota bacterium]
MAVFRRLLDGIESWILAKVEHAPLHVDGVREVHEARARWVGQKVRAELHLAVAPDLIGGRVPAISDHAVQAFADHVPHFGGATVQACPDLQEGHSDFNSPTTAPEAL